MTRQRFRIAFATMCAVASLAVQAGVASAAPGDLDGTFGTGGLVFTDFPPSAAIAGAVFSYTDGSGRILVAGKVVNVGGNEQLALARYDSNGALDASFGSGGKVIRELGQAASVLDLEVQPDGKILVLVPCPSTGCENLLLRFSADGGQLDSGFGGGDGKVTFPFVPQDMDLQPDGRIVVGGNEVSPFGSPRSYSISRLNSDGSPDTSLNADGNADGVIVTTTPFPSSVGNVVSLSGGSILAVGTETTSTGSTSTDNVALLKFNSNGSLDSGFGTNGKRLYDAQEDSFGRLLVRAGVQSSGRIVVAVEVASTPGEPHFNALELVGFDAQGSLDQTFGSNGVSRRPAMPDPAGGIAILPDDRIAVASSVTTNWVVGRYLSNGTLDAPFGERTVPVISSGHVSASDVAIDQNQNVIVTGIAMRNSEDANFVTGRFQGSESPPPPASESDTATQDTLVDVTAAPVEGVLNIEVSQPTVDFGSVQEGTSSSATSVGTLTYTNTLDANRSWDVTVAATDLVKGSDRIDFENLSFNAGDTISPSGPTVPITGPTAFSGGDPDGFSAPHPLANATSASQGTFTHAGSTATLSVPFGTPAGSDYTGMLQYTITG